MRGLTPGARSPAPLIDLLPAVLQEDPVVIGLTTGLDEVLAPVFASLDCLGVYLDPRLAPADFLDALAGWVGVPLRENWPEERRRDAVEHAVDLHRCRGTVRGLQWQLDLMTGGRAQVVDSGGVTWSRAPSDSDGVTDSVTDGVTDGADRDPAILVVRLRREGMPDAEVDAVRDLVAMAKPAHVPHRVEVT